MQQNGLYRTSVIQPYACMTTIMTLLQVLNTAANVEINLLKVLVSRSKLLKLVSNQRTAYQLRLFNVMIMNVISLMVAIHVYNVMTLYRYRYRGIYNIIYLDIDTTVHVLIRGKLKVLLYLTYKLLKLS